MCISGIGSGRCSMANVEGRCSMTNMGGRKVTAWMYEHTIGEQKQDK